MKPALLDTDALSLYLKAGDDGIVQCADQYIRQYGRLNLSIITYYEIISGLRHHRAGARFRTGDTESPPF